MSVQSEIDRIKNAVSESYSALDEVAGVTSESQLVNDLPNAIRSLDKFAPKDNPIFTGSISLGRVPDPEDAEETTVGQNSVAFGEEVIASGLNSHAEGYQTESTANNTHAEGAMSKASGNQAHAEGFQTLASGYHAHSEGRQTTASGEGTHAEGYKTRSVDAWAHSEGYETIAGALHAHAEGNTTKAYGVDSHTEGARTKASGSCSHAEGSDTNANKDRSHAEGSTTIADGLNSHAEGYQTQANGNNTHAEGRITIATGTNSHAEGHQTATNGDNSHAEGLLTTATGANSHVEGSETVAEGWCAHAEGYKASASAAAAHAEGSNTVASKDCAHAEGMQTEASGLCAHAEGYSTTASGEYSHAEGASTQALAPYSHVEGFETEANGWYSHAVGWRTISHATLGQYVVGVLNQKIEEEGSYFIVGNGIIGVEDSPTPEDIRSNCFRVTHSGVYGVGAWNASGADYAEMFEWVDGNPDNEDRVGRFVTLDGEKIRIATDEDNYILGVVSGSPSVVGDVYDDQWQGMYEMDIFGRPIWEDVTVPEVRKDDVVVSPARTVRQRKVNPDYDPNTPYIPRTKRPEWNAVGMMGKLVMVDDGSCQVNGWAKASANGVATHSDIPTKYRIMARLDETHVKVLIL